MVALVLALILVMKLNVASYDMSGVMKKPTFFICENKDADQLRGNREAVTAKLISAFVFATRIVHSLYYKYPKFQASSHLLWLYSPVCVGPGRKPECWFSHDTAHIDVYCLKTIDVMKCLMKSERFLQKSLYVLRNIIEK